MSRELSYQQRVLLAALELTKEYAGKRGYDFFMGEEDLFLTPWMDLSGNGKKGYSRTMRVTQDEILGNDETLVSELEQTVHKLRFLGLQAGRGIVQTF